MAAQVPADSSAEATADGWVFPPDSRRIEDTYELANRLGEPGQFGYARLCVHKSSGEKRAVKVINKGKFSVMSQRRQFFQQLRDEINIMKRMHHNNVIRFFEVYEDRYTLFIVMEYCGGGELFDRIQQRQNYSERDASAVLRQAVEAIKYLHDNSIAHCDLKPDNFLFLSHADDAPLKVIDFGMSKHVRSRAYFQKFCGTPYYVAPEVIDGRYKEAVDMWSIGVVMFVMLFGFPPFYVNPQERHADSKILRKVKKGFTPEVRKNYGPWFPQAIPCSASARDLISRLLESSVAKRFTADEALAHPWLLGDAAPSQPVSAEVIKGLKTFRAACRFKQAVLGVMVNQLSDSQVSELKTAFHTIDANGDGTITRDELKTALRQIDSELKDEDIERIFSDVDVDDDGSISYEELALSTVNRRLMQREERLWEAFRAIDTNGDGKITPEELSKAIGTGSDLALARELIASADFDKSGTVEYEEFIRLFDEKSGLNLHATFEEDASAADADVSPAAAAAE